jgi:hypothetical protein
MDFKQARKEFNILKRAWVNGAISLDEFQNKVDCELEVTDSNSGLWKIDEDSEEWLYFDSETLEWIEKSLPEPDSMPEQFSEPSEVRVAIKPPPAPDLPENLSKKTQTDNLSASSLANSEAICGKCGKHNRSDVKFCTDCGEPIQPVCSNCKKPVKPGNKFCTSCGKPL